MRWISLVGILLLIHLHLPDTLSVTYKGQVIADIKRVEYTISELSLIDLDKMNHLVDSLAKQIYVKPQNARIGDHGEILPDQIGFKLNRKLFTEQLYAYLFSGVSSPIEAPLTAIYPKVDSELLAGLRDKPIGHYITYFNAANKNRAHNINLAAKAINDIVVFPGEIFSFNQAVGMRTKEKGYMQAKIIVRGEFSEGIGGGICQVSSTLFNAIDRAGLQIVKRYSHSRNVPYVLPGRDATVSWDGPDLSFRNQYNQPILIRTYAGGGKTFVTIYSSDVIEYKPREVLSMSERLPEETSTETDAKSHSPR